MYDAFDRFCLFVVKCCLVIMVIIGIAAMAVFIDILIK
jgi:hypothetical protein